MSGGGQRPGCAACFPPDARAAYANLQRLTTVARIVDESHLIVSVRRCEECGQRFVVGFTELVDWADGEDPQRRAVAPISPEEAERLLGDPATLGESVVDALGAGRDVLVMEHPKDGERRVGYVRGARILGPHD